MHCDVDNITPFKKKNELLTLVLLKPVNNFDFETNFNPLLKKKRTKTREEAKNQVFQKCDKHRGRTREIEK
jgi:hypothetical protein